MLSSTSGSVRRAVAEGSRRLAASAAPLSSVVPSGQGPIEFGSGGRSSVSGLKAAVFGSTGFLGSYVCCELGECGSVGYLATRGCEMDSRHLKPMFDLGNVGIYFYSPRDEDSIREVIEGADVVINCVGKHYETKKVVPTDENGRLKLFGGSRVNYSYHEVNVDIAQKIARISAEMGVDKLIHVSALGASENNKSQWFHTKALGEQAVRAEFPEATIVRPATLFGDEDRFLNWVAMMSCRVQFPFLTYGSTPILGDGQQLVQPVWVVDVAKAIMHAAQKFPGKQQFAYSRIAPEEEALEPITLELAGPKDYTREEISKFVTEVIHRKNNHMFKIHPFVYDKIAYFADMLPGPYVNQDEIKVWDQDIVLTPKEGVKTFADLGMEPTAVERVAFAFLARYRPFGHFAFQQGANH